MNLVTGIPPFDDPHETRTVAASGQAGETIGPYRLLERVGEGGMGDVWLAEQVQPVRRQVAVKVIKAGMDTAQVVARFEAERQALAILDHPAIAKVFDAGTTSLARPYFAMEYVRGDAITDYCDRQGLGIHERLELFLHVCEGVQHAHQKGIIHRDLKPSNVLVALQDDRPFPKIIDFGIAKAVSQPLTDRTLHTAIADFVGTPGYMSPEQAAGEVDIDTRTDVYALGVLLYELLTGVLPFDRALLKHGSVDAVRRAILEADPPRPSTRISRHGTEAAEIASRRRVDAARLRAQLKGDLDWITMKALEKDRRRRYGSASDLAADIQRHLQHRPVSAGAPGAGYRARKFVRRHRFGVAAGAVLVAMIAAFAAALIVQAQRVARERDRANLEAATAKQVSDFLVSLFQVADPSESRGSRLTAREILDRGSQRIEQTLKDQPDVQARLQGTLGEVYTNLGLFDEAGANLERAVQTAKRVLGEDDTETVTAVHRLANVLWHQDRLAEAKPLYEDVIARRTRLLGADHRDSLKAKFDLASLYMVQGRWAEAEPLATAVLDVQRRVLGSEHNDTLASMNNVHHMFLSLKRLPEAERLARELLAIRRRLLGADHPDTLLSMNNLATTMKRLGQHAEAERLYREAIDGSQRVRGETHPYTASVVLNLGLLYRDIGRFADAEPFMLDGHRRFSTGLGQEHRETRWAVEQLVELYEKWNKPPQAAQWRARLR